MALNKFMHPRNPYKNKRPDFKALAVKYEEFRKHATQDVKGNVHLDFKKPESLRALSWAILKDDFDVDVTIPLDRLIPTIPLRLNYILWLEDLIGNVSSARGIDIGCGASCIYPIIGAKKNSWKFLTSEADKMNFSYATKNVRDNCLQNLIEVREVEEDVMLYDMLMEGDGQFDFCMTNPPFYGSNMEAWGMLNAPRKEERAEPNSISTASPAESITPGGEVAFVKRLIADSLLLKDRVRVYTTMLGKKTSMFPLKEELKRNGITNFGHTEFCQGRTMRWGLAWTLDSSLQIPKPASKQLKSVKEKPPLVYKIPKELKDMKHSVTDIGVWIMSKLDELKILYEPENSSSQKVELEMLAMENTWSHQRRKRRAEQNKKAGDDHKNVNNSSSAVAVSSSLTQVPIDPAVPIDTTVPINPAVAIEPAVPTDPTVPEQPPNASQKSAEIVSSDGKDNDKKEEFPKKRKSEEMEEIEMTDAKKQNVDDSNLSKILNTAELSFDDVDDYLFKAHLKLLKDADDILLEIKWIDGQNNESLYQIMQYFKNNIK